MNYKISPTTNGQFHVTIIGNNGEPLNNSETLTSKANALKNIKAVITGHLPIHGAVFIVYDIPDKSIFLIEVVAGNLFVKDPVPMNKRQLKKLGL